MNTCETMSFNSKSSKSHAEATVNKLFSSLLPGTQGTTSKQSPSLSSAELLSIEIENKNKLSKEELKKIHKQNKFKQHKKIKKALEDEKRFNKLAKYHLIKHHKTGGELSEEEAKYLKKLVKKNVNSLNRVSEIDDMEIKSELDQVRQDILKINKEKHDKKAKRIQNKKTKDFNSKVAKGMISYPGLTPGLAPVGLDDSDDE